MDFRRESTRRSKDFITTRSQGDWSVVIKSTGPLDDGGGLEVSNEALKMSANAGDSWSAQCFKVDGETESGPAVDLPLLDDERVDSGVGGCEGPAVEVEVELAGRGWGSLSALLH